MAITIYNSTQDIINNLQSLKGKTKLNFYQEISIYDDETNIRRQNGTFEFEEDSSSKNVQDIGKLYHEVLLLMNFLQTKSQVKSMNIVFYDLYYTVIKNRVDKETVNDDYEKIYIILMISLLLIFLLDEKMTMKN